MADDSGHPVIHAEFDRSFLFPYDFRPMVSLRKKQFYSVLQGGPFFMAAFKIPRYTQDEIELLRLVPLASVKGELVQLVPIQVMPDGSVGGKEIEVPYIRIVLGRQAEDRKLVEGIIENLDAGSREKSLRTVQFAKHFLGLEHREGGSPARCENIPHHPHHAISTGNEDMGEIPGENRKQYFQHREWIIAVFPYLDERVLDSPEIDHHLIRFLKPLEPIGHDRPDQSSIFQAILPEFDLNTAEKFLAQIHVGVSHSRRQFRPKPEE